MDLLLTHAYHLREDAAERRVMRPYPPLGILHLSAYLKRAGCELRVFDATFARPRDFSDLLRRTAPRVVGISVNLMTRRRAVTMLRECRSRRCITVVGGPDVFCSEAEYLQSGADVCVLGEGEETITELLPHLLRHGPEGLEHIRGIAYRGAEGRVLHTPPRDRIRDLDSLPLPDREAVDIPRYLRSWREHHGAGSVSLITARGCPFECAWCSRGVFGETHRRRSPAAVADEVEGILKAYRPDMLWFADDVFTIHHGWIRSFHEETGRRGLRVPFECISRADRLDGDILKTLAAMGAKRIWYGSESGSQRILDAMHRGVRADRIRSVTKQARELGIQTGLFVMLGYTGETMRDIDETVAHLVEAAPDAFLTTLAYPIRGTPFHREVADRLHQAGSWGRTSDRRTGFAGRHSRLFYWFAARFLTNEVACRKLRAQPTAGFLAAAGPFLKARAARLGMQLTRHVQS
ncbi:MAG: radical SAM protein [Bacteroidota bacterium]